MSCAIFVCAISRLLARVFVSFAGEGKPLIDLNYRLLPTPKTDKNHPHSENGWGTVNDRKIPKQKYTHPVQRASKGIIEDAIIHAAAIADLHLVKKCIEKLLSENLQQHWLATLAHSFEASTTVTQMEQAYQHHKFFTGSLLEW